jgi:hypothetical protein
MKNTPDAPPWEPIADWLARLPGVSCDEEHEDTREPSNATKRQVRKRYEKTAKAIAYDIAMEQSDDGDPGGYQVTHESEQKF